MGAAGQGQQRQTGNLGTTRLKNLRSFTRYLQQFEPRIEVPDDSTLGRIGQRLAPQPVSFASLVQHFFTEYPVIPRALSPRTIASYRDAMMLFLDFAHKRLGKMPTALNLADIEPDLIRAFLDHLGQHRHNSVRSRNLRLTALHASLKFAARRDVSSFHVIERALDNPHTDTSRRTWR
jgi:hypothetical protein